MGTNGQFGSIRKLPSGRFQVRYRHLGRRVAAGTTFRTKADARAFLAGVETDLNRGSFVDPHAGAITFAEYASWWLEHRPLRPRTRETYASQLKHLLAAFGPARLSDIAPADVRSWHGRLSRTELHPNTVAKIYRMLRTILSTAVEDGLLPTNPVRVRGASREQQLDRPLLTWDDVASIALKIEPQFEALVWTAAASGLRFGELAGLEVRHLDTARAELRVTQALAWQKEVGAVLVPLKSDSAYRTVVVPDQIVDRIQEHINHHRPGATADDAIFVSVTGRPLVNRYFAPYWRRATGALELRHVRFHDLRHLAGTEAASAGGSMREVMARLGHSSSAASLRYLKAAEIRDRDIAQLIGLRMPPR